MSRGSFKKIQNFDIFFSADPPANTSTVQKYGPSSNGSGQGVTWVQFCPKQLVSISHPTPDLIRPRSNFHLSVFNPKSQIAMHMTRKWNRSKKNVFKWTKINAEPFKASTLAISDNFSINKSHLGPSSSSATGNNPESRPKKKKKWRQFFNFFFDKEKIYRHGSFLFASGCHIKLVAFWSKQKGSISHAAPCELWDPPNFHLSVSNPKPLNRHAYA